MSGFLKKLYAFINGSIVHKETGNIHFPIDAQRQYLKQFKKAKNEYEMSYAKYCCFMRYCYEEHALMPIIFNIGSMLLLPFLFFKFKNSGKKIVRNPKRIDALIENVPRLPNTDVIPDEIKRMYPNSKDLTRVDYKGIYLTQTGIKICKNLRKRYFFHFYYRFIVMMKLAQFTKYIETYNPKAIVFYSVEREFAGPLQTLLCEQNDSKYISFMHGDYLYSVSFAYMHFSHYYIWDAAYDKMFKELHCEFSTTNYVPQKLKGLADALNVHDCTYFATYYLSNEGKEVMEKINREFEKLLQCGLRCKVRPHPRFTNQKNLHEVFKNIEIENTNSTSLSKSVTETMYCVGLNTTVLSQVYYSGKEVVIDDISNPELYEESKMNGQIHFKREYVKLSDLVYQATTSDSYDSSYQFWLKN